MVGLIGATGLYFGTSDPTDDDGQPGLAAAALAAETPGAFVEPAPEKVSRPDAVEPTPGPTAKPPKATPKPAAKPKVTAKARATPRRTAKPKPVAQPATKQQATALPYLKPKPTPKPTRRPGPTAVPEARLADSAPDEPGATASSAEAPSRSSVAEATPRRVNGWVCDGAVRTEDPSGQRWSVSKVSFLPGTRYERLVLHLKRIGPDSGGPASVTAEAFATSEIREHVPGAARPRAGKTTLSLHLADGVRATLGLRGYRPKGLDTLKEFSAYSAGGNSSKLLISVAGDGCFRLRAPVWSVDGSSPNSGQVWLDVKS